MYEYMMYAYMYVYIYIYIYIYILRTCIHACFIHAHRYLFIMYTHSCECFKMTYVHIDFIFTVTHLYNNFFAAKMKKSNARHGQEEQVSYSWIGYIAEWPLCFCETFGENQHANSATSAVHQFWTPY